MCDFDEIFTKLSICRLRSDFPFLPDLYLDFIEKFGAPQLSWLYMLPANNNEFATIYQRLDKLKSYKYGSGYVPFAESEGKSDIPVQIYCFNDQGAVYYFEPYHDDFEPEFVCNSFEEFISDCVLGNRYEEFEYIEDNDFYSFVYDHGWSTISPNEYCDYEE